MIGGFNMLTKDMALKQIAALPTEKLQAVLAMIHATWPEYTDNVNNIKFGVIDGPIVDYAKFDAWDADILDMCEEYI